ncbi:MAG: FAD-dependent oxidoreductase [Desulfovibrionaceae bacterium]|nr:FAD-dependent oxidoreductase [Desulfovibrionaceae bacterium]
MPQHVVVIGAVALGPKSACRFKRLEPDSKVTMIDKSDIISYGGCGIPYYVSGEVSEAMQLRTTTFHMLRDEKFFADCKGVDVQALTEAVRIDRAAKKVHVRRVDTGGQAVLDYDRLVLATGGRPRRLNLPGEDLPGVHYVSSPHDAVSIRQAVTNGEVEKAVVVGAGFIGLEMAEAFADMWGIETTVIEIEDQIMPRYISPVLARMGQTHMEDNGVSFRLGQTVLRLEGDERVRRVVTGKGSLDADLVIISAGVIPNSELAVQAGLSVSERGGIKVDRTMRTSDPDIFAGGDCVELTNQITGQPFYLPMGSMANRQGRVIGTNLAGGKAEFDGAVGTYVVKIFEKSLCGAGLCLSGAERFGFEAMSVLLVQLDRAHFYPEKELMTLELVVEKKTRRVLGIQGFGSKGDATVGRINTVSAMLRHRPTIADLSNLEMAYSPPFSSAVDILNTIGNMAENALDGKNRGFWPNAFPRLWEDRDSGECFFLDCREAADAKHHLEAHPEHWHNIPQGDIAKRLKDIPRDRTVVLMCNTGGRSYEAQITLDHHGFDKVLNLHGGLAALKAWGFEI